MPRLSEENWGELKEGLSSLVGGYFSGVLVGFGCLVLHFDRVVSSGSSLKRSESIAYLRLSCDFQVLDGDQALSGQGSRPETAVPLFRLLNEDITYADADCFGQIVFGFANNCVLKIKSNESGYEAYEIGIRGRGEYIGY